MNAARAAWEYLRSWFNSEAQDRVDEYVSYANWAASL